MRWTAQYLMAVFYRERYRVGWGEAAKKAEKFVDQNVETVETSNKERVFREIADRATILVQRIRR